MPDGRRTPEFREAARARAQAHWSDPEVRRRHGELTRLKMADPAIREKISRATKKALADPAIRERQLALLASPEIRAKISAHTRAAMANPEARNAITETNSALVRWRAKCLADLQAAWSAAPVAVRRTFLAEIFGEHPAP